MTDAASEESDGVDPGRRYLTLLFADLSGSTAMAAAVEAEHYAALLAKLRRAYQDTIRKHGGMVVRMQGDGVLAMFGYPKTREDDGRRAVEAALDLHQVVRALPPPVPAAATSGLALHTGIHSGLVLVAAGDIERGRFELLGSAPNIAARLSDAAQPHEILVSEETLGPAVHFFAAQASRQLLLKGRPEPLTVVCIQARAEVATRFEARARRGFAPFVGRRAELEALDSALQDAMTGGARFVAILAAAGMGKTRLTEEFARRAAQRDCRIHRGYCESYLSAEPLQPFLQMLRALFRLPHRVSAVDAAQSVDAILATIDPALASHRGEYLRALSLDAGDGPATTRSTPQATIAALRDLFASLASRQPLVIFIDDWQWADDASNQVLTALRGLGRCPMLVLLATRGFGRRGASALVEQTIELAPLTEGEAAQTIGQMLPQADPFVAAEISKYSGGNPLFIEELCHSAAHDDSPRRLGHVHGSAAWLNHLVESRVERLPAPQAEIVRAAAVIGNVIPSWLLERITGCSENDPVLHALAERDFLFPGEQPGTLRFKHGITRDVIFDSVGLHARTAMHLRIADALVQEHDTGVREESYEALAYHYAGGGNTPQAAHYAELAGNKALAASALDRAKQQYRAALAALDQLAPSAERSQRWVAIALRLALACVFDASRGDLAIFERAVVLATETGDAAAIARARYWLGFISYSLGEAQAAIAHCEVALAAAQRGNDGPLAVQIGATLGQAYTAACHYDRALELLDDAIAVKRRHRSGKHTTVGLAFSLVCRAYVLGDRGLFAQAHECFDEALSCVVGVTHEIVTSIHGWRSAVLLWQGQWGQARSAADESARIAELTGSLFQLSMARAMGGYAAWMLDRDPASLAEIAEATTWLGPRRTGLYRSLNHGWLAEGHASLGQRAEARHHAALALLRARKRDLIGVAMTYRALARLSSDAGDDKAADRCIALALRTARMRESAHELAVTRWCEAAIAQSRGQWSRSAALLDQAMPAFESMGMVWHFSAATQLRQAASSRAG
jgi:class 3 adenylate cyclase/tetratricopeptide (TPR) repeat protein